MLSPVGPLFAYGIPSEQYSTISDMGDPRFIDSIPKGNEILETISPQSIVFYREYDPENGKISRHKTKSVKPVIPHSESFQANNTLFYTNTFNFHQNIRHVNPSYFSQNYFSLGGEFPVNRSPLQFQQTPYYANLYIIGAMASFITAGFMFIIGGYSECISGTENEIRACRRNNRRIFLGSFPVAGLGYFFTVKYRETWKDRDDWDYRGNIISDIPDRMISIQFEKKI